MPNKSVLWSLFLLVIVFDQELSSAELAGVFEEDLGFAFGHFLEDDDVVVVVLSTISIYPEREVKSKERGMVKNSLCRTRMVCQSAVECQYPDNPYAPCHKPACAAKDHHRLLHQKVPAQS